MTTTTTSRPGGAEQKILDALQQLQQATAGAIADHAGVAYSTTTARLRAMQHAGRVQRLPGDDGQALWQAADPASYTDSSPAVASAQPAGPTSTSPSKPKPAKSTTRQNTTDDKDTGRNATGEEAIGKNPARGNRGTGGKSARAGNTTRHADNKTGTTVAQDTGDTRVTAPPAPPARPPITQADGDSPAATPRPRRAKGALRAQVLAVLQDHPDQTFKVSGVCKQLPGASAGAIANALYKLAADGNARQVADKPATYQAE